VIKNRTMSDLSRSLAFRLISENADHESLRHFLNHDKVGDDITLLNLTPPHILTMLTLMLLVMMMMMIVMMMIVMMIVMLIIIFMLMLLLRLGFVSSHSHENDFISRVMHI
jgi:hypothetical protein